MSSSSLSSVVSSLLRAQLGTSVPSSVTDEELDRHVAELIVKEAKQKADRYLQEGVRAYLPDNDPDPNLPKANKRFLSAIIRNTDEHNKAILRAQAEAAQEAKADREEQERRERRARALEATGAERLRRLMGSSSRRSDTAWDRRRDSGRRRSRDNGSEKHDDKYLEKGRRRRDSRSRSPERASDASHRHRRRKRHDEEDREEKTSKRHRRRSRSRNSEDGQYRTSDKHESDRKTERRAESLEPRRSKGKGKEVEGRQTASLSSHRTSGRSTPKDVVAYSDDELKGELKSPVKRSRHSPSPPRKASPANLASQFELRETKLAAPPPPASPTLSEEEDIERFRPRRRRRASPSRSEAKQKGVRSPSPNSLPSKMDKYFEESYDPRLDTGPMTIPEVPSTGLINGAEFEGWEAMLDIVRQRREDKAERKRMERLGLLPDKKSKEQEAKTTKTSEAWTMDSGTSVMDIKYSKRGAVREWDLGKGGF